MDNKKKIISIIIIGILTLLILIPILKISDEHKNGKKISTENIESTDETEEPEPTFEDPDSVEESETALGFDISQYINKDDNESKPSVLDIFNGIQESSTETDENTDITLESESESSSNSNVPLSEYEKSIQSDIYDLERFEEYTKKNKGNNSYSDTSENTGNVDNANNGRLVENMMKENGAENYDQYNVGVDITRGTFDIEAGINKDGILTGEDADAFINAYNSMSRLKFNVECADGLENIVIPIRIDYKNPLDDINKKIEPQFVICNGLSETLSFNGDSYVPIVNVIYSVKNLAFREGYLLTKIPDGDNKDLKLKFKGYDEDASYSVGLK